jgi:His/Glu/Gln/Arg/opine family amino acid ABC transporter permease subunit
MEFNSSLFWEALTSSAMAKGALIALGLAVVSQVLAIVLGFGVMLTYRSPVRHVSMVGRTYVWFFRAIPILLVLILVWNALPQVLPVFRGSWFSPFLAAMLALTIVEAAYMSEILRSALASIDEGQALAARALGMTPRQVMRRVLIPQMIRVAIPPTGNEFITMLKGTTLASVISLQELLAAANVGVSVTFGYAEYYGAATVYYLVLVSLLMVVQSRLERRYRWKSSPSKAPKAVLSPVGVAS